MKYLLDTHTWIWWHMRPANLSDRVASIIGDSDNYGELLLSAISPWEFCKILEKGRLGISMAPLEWMDRALEMPKLRLVPLSPKLVYCSTTLPQPFHSDPADQIIVATAREENAVILTKDERILSYGQVRSLWA
jgi:PIN domain nuclease of toxin-antitoxin system